MRNITLVAIAMLATACGPNLEDSCQNYIDAATACANEAFGAATTSSATTSSTSTGGALDGFCSAYEGLGGSDAKDAAEYLDCLADAYGAADCTTAEGYTAATTATTECVGA
jgi:hypothetical protein